MKNPPGQKRSILYGGGFYSDKRMPPMDSPRRELSNGAQIIKNGTMRQNLCGNANIIVSVTGNSCEESLVTFAPGIRFSNFEKRWTTLVVSFPALFEI